MNQRSLQVDAVIDELWPRLSDVALAAVGGYGRGELFPYSDIDVLVISKRTDLGEYLAPFIRALWDHGLRVSQSIHSVEDLASVSDTNLELSISLLDRRFLQGDPALFEKVRDPARDRLIPALVQLSRERHARYGNTIYHLEPNVKDAPGALRDLHVLRWIARLERIEIELPQHGLLFRIRTVLHEAAHRDQNVLSFQMQDECAATLGFPDPAGLMRAYYREAAPLYRAIVRRMESEESRRSLLFRNFLDRSARFSNADFSVVRGHVFFRTPPVDGLLLPALFEFIARHGLHLASDSEERIEHRAAPGSLSWRQLSAILELPHAALAVRAMFDSGYLAAVFPALRGIECLVIRDFYHRYTVDEHTLIALETAANLRSRADQLGEIAPFGEIARETPDYAMLLAAILFHDSGKGVPGHNHADASCRIAAEAFAQIAMPSAQAETALFLIQKHLEMSRLMTGRDLSDPATAAFLAETVGTVERLKMLTVLTYSDINAVNPSALTPWRTSLLWKLYAATARHLTRKLDVDPQSGDMPTRYALTHSPEEIECHRQMESSGRLVNLASLNGAYRLTVVAPDRPFLFASAAGTLASFGMNILRAEAFTNQRHSAIDTFDFVDPVRTLELNPTECARLEHLVAETVSGKRNAEALLKSRHVRKRVSTLGSVSFDNTASPRATLFEITAEDRPRLLFDLARAFSAAGCNIEVVLIDTEGRKAIDVFYVTQNAQPLDELTARQLTDSLRAVIP